MPTVELSGDVPNTFMSRAESQCVCGGDEAFASEEGSDGCGDSIWLSHEKGDVGSGDELALSFSVIVVVA